MSTPTSRTSRSPFSRSARSRRAAPGAPDAVTRIVVIAAMLLRGRAAPGSVPVPHVAHGEPQLPCDAAGTELGEEHRPGTAFVARPARLCERAAAPAVLAAHVELVLEDEEAGALEQVDPVVRRALQLPPLVVVHAGRHAHEHARRDSAQLAQRRFVALRI